MTGFTQGETTETTTLTGTILNAHTIAAIQADERPKEPAYLQDMSGSFDDPVEPGSTVKKWTVATSLAQALTGRLGAVDTEAADEGSKGGGGLLAIGFNHPQHPIMIGDLNPGNFSKPGRTGKWDRLEPDGPTFMMPAFTALETHYQEEFGDRPEELQPVLITVACTDGALHDFSSVTQHIAGVHGKMYLYVVLLGSGDQYQEAYKQWSHIAQQNAHVMVKAAGATVDGVAIAQEALAMFQ